MIPALIDLHVRPEVDEAGGVDYARLRDAARAVGLDGLVVTMNDRAPPAAEGDSDVLVFAGAEVDTDVGRLICIPATRDDWFQSAGWRQLRDGEAVYSAVAIAGAFGERGGAVLVAQPFDRDLDHEAFEGRFVGTENLSGVVVTSSPRHTTSNERALDAARGAGLSGVGGSAAAPGNERFGAVATVFASPPADQAALAASLRGGRVWPVEIVPAPPSADASDGERRSGRDSAQSQANGGRDDGGREAASREAASRDGGDKAGASEGEERKGRPAKKVAERKTKGSKKGEREDNRGNRLDPSVLRTPMATPFDRRQPDLDPIAKLYGLADRRPSDRNGHLSDAELDRVNGNRNRGHDPNVMAAPDFRELRAERQHVNLLLETISDRRDDERNSIALRFAISALEQAAQDNGVSPLEAAEQLASQHGGARRKRRRRRT